jgi:hypothetical protein
MSPEEFDVKAFEAKARTLAHAFEHACARCALHLQNVAALPYGEMRTELLAAARDAVRDARKAIRERQALSEALRGPSLAPSDLTPFESAVAQLEAVIGELSPSREA